MVFCQAFIETIVLLFWIILDPFMRLGRCICPKRKKSIKGEVVLETGAGQGLGRELVNNMSGLGPVLVLWDINQESVDMVAAELRSKGCRVYSYKVDVTNESEVITVANRVKHEVGDVSMLINNAGVFSGKSICNLSSSAVRRCFEVNAIAHFWILQQFLPRMMELNRGHIVAVASMAGHMGTSFMTDYCASKFAAVGLMDSLYNELRTVKKADIRLTTINPIIITTGLISNVKSRFPCLLPLLSVEKTAKLILESILREEEEVFIPSKSKHLKNLSNCFSKSTKFKLLNYVNYGFNPDEKIPEVNKGLEIV